MEYFAVQLRKFLAGYVFLPLITEEKVAQCVFEGENICRELDVPVLAKPPDCLLRVRDKVLVCEDVTLRVGDMHGMQTGIAHHKAFHVRPSKSFPAITPGPVKLMHDLTLISIGL